MKLDQNQKENFVQYWGRCPLIDTKSKKLVTIEEVKVRTKGFSGVGYSYELIMDGEHEILDDHGLPHIDQRLFTTTDLENLEPYFISTGYYQLYPDLAYWINRKTNREVTKGMARVNTDVKYISRVSKNPDHPVFFSKKEFSLIDAARIYHEKISDIRKNKYLTFKGLVPGELDLLPLHEKLNRLFDGKREGVAISLSPDICIAASDFEIPVVFYKLNPVGYYFENKVYVDKNKEVTKEAVMEGVGLDVEIYAE